jgi:hypothetical protein
MKYLLTFLIFSLGFSLSAQESVVTVKQHAYALPIYYVPDYDFNRSYSFGYEITYNIFPILNSLQKQEGEFHLGIGGNYTNIINQVDRVEEDVRLYLVGIAYFGSNLQWQMGMRAYYLNDFELDVNWNGLPNNFEAFISRDFRIKDETYLRILIGAGNSFTDTNIVAFTGSIGIVSAIKSK